MFFHKEQGLRRRAERAARLQRDLQEVEELCAVDPSVLRFTTRGVNTSAPEKYVVEAQIRSIIAITKHGLPVTHSGFRFEIVLPSGYPSKRGARCTIYPAPFHPHVSRGVNLFKTVRCGVWVDPDDSVESVARVLLRVVHSLRFDSKYIKSEAKRIGNRDALEWYEDWQTFFAQNSQPWFPTDTTTLPRVLREPRKQFDIQEARGGMSRSGHLPRVAPNAELTRPRKSFEIIEATPPYQLIPKKVPVFEPGALQASHQRGTSSGYCLYILPRATAAMFEHISWGKTTHDNTVEQGGILLGQVFRDDDARLVYGVVEEAIPGESASATGAYLEMGHATWKKMIDRVDAILESAPDSNLQVIGWYHTHPNTLDVFMSGTDMATQRCVFHADWQFAVVLNPQRKIWRVFRGDNCEECRGYISGTPCN